MTIILSGLYYRKLNLEAFRCSSAWENDLRRVCYGSRCSSSLRAISLFLHKAPWSIIWTYLCSGRDIFSPIYFRAIEKSNFLKKHLNCCHGVVIHLRIIGSLENAGYPIEVIVWVVVKTNYKTIFRLILLGRRRFISFTNLPFTLLLPFWEVCPFYKIFNLFVSNLFLIKCRTDKIRFCENPRFFASLETVYTNVSRTRISYKIKLLKMRKWIKKCHN